MRMILSEVCPFITKEQLLDIYNYATSEKFSPLIIDMEADLDKKFRKGFLEYIPIPE